jgi:hypothetical protein
MISSGGALSEILRRTACALIKQTVRKLRDALRCAQFSRPTIAQSEENREPRRRDGRDARRKSGGHHRLRLRGRLSRGRPDASDVLDVAAEVARAVKVVEEEFRRVVEAPALQQVLMRAREPRRPPGAQQRSPLAEARVFDHTGAQLGRPVEFGQQKVAMRFPGHCAAIYSART